MRFHNFELKAIGPFTDTLLEFPDSPGLTLIYGPNESGKSSCLKAFRTFLFGFKRRTDQNFLHPSKHLCVGAEISQGSERFQLYRYKKNKNDLLDAQGVPVSERRLSALLGGVSELVYDTLYGLDHQTLVSGGEALLSGGGELSESLFSAGLGPRFHKLRLSLEEEAAALWSGKSSKKPIDLAMKSWHEAQATLRKESLTATQWREFCHLLDSTIAEGERLKAEFEEVDREIRRLERLQRAAPRVARRTELEERLAELSAVVRLSEDFPERRRLLESERQIAESRVQLQTEELRTIVEELEGLPARPVHLSFSDSITALHRRMSGVIEAREQLPRLTLRIESLQEEKARLQKLLGAEEVSRLASDERAPRKKANTLVSEKARLSERCAQDAKALELQQLQWLRVREELDGLEFPRALVEQEALISRLRDALALDSEIVSQGEKWKAIQTQLQQDLTHLPSWGGELPQLMALAVPPSGSLVEFQERFRQMEESLRSSQRKLSEIESQMADIQGELESLFRGEKALGPEQIQELRDLRDQTWLGLTQAWSEGSLWTDVEGEARSFQSQVRNADHLTDQLLSDGERLARLQVHRQQLRSLEEDYKTEQRQRKKLQAEWDSTQGEWLELWEKAPGVLVERPEKMISWCQRRTALLDLSLLGQREEQALKELQIKHSECLQDFERAFSGAKLRHPTVKEMVFSLGLEIDAHKALAQKLTDLQQREAGLKARIDELTVEQVASQKAMAEWKNSWQQCLLELSLPPETQVEELDELFQLRDEIRKLEDNLATETRRKDAAKTQVQSFVGDAQSIAEQLEETFSSENVVTQTEHWWSELGKATEIERTRSQLKKRESELRDKLRSGKAELEDKVQNYKLLLAEARLEHGEDLTAAEFRSGQARNAENALRQLEDELRQESGGTTVAEFCEQVRDCDFDTLEVRLQGLRQAKKELFEKTKENSVTLGQLEARRAEMDGTQRGAKAAQIASESLAEAKAHIEQYLKLRLAEHMLTSEMNAYREAHQGGLLDSSGSYFQKLSCGYYRGLSTNYDSKGEPILVAVSREGRKVEVAALSDGTRDQLYLSLRLATIAKRFENQSPVPLILDDVLVQFDSERARAALEVLGDFAQHTQIVLFSHLERDRDLAMTMEGQVQLIELERVRLV